MSSVYDKTFVYRSVCNVLEKVTAVSELLFIVFISFRVRRIWNIAENRNLFHQLKSELGLYNVLLTFPKTSTKKTLLNLELQRSNSQTLKRLFAKKKMFS